MEGDLDMEFIPNMELYKDDSDDEFVYEEHIIQNKEIEKQPCSVCEYSKATKAKYGYNTYIWNFYFCTECKSYLSYIFEKKLSEIAQYEKYRKVNDIIKYIFENSKDIDTSMKQVNNAFINCITDYKYKIENHKPFDNMKIFDCENNFSCFTTHKRINKFLTMDAIEKITEDTYKWKNPTRKNYFSLFQITETNMKENICFECRNSKYLYSDTIFVNKKDFSRFIKEHILIHFSFAFCSKCKDKCIMKRDLCYEYFTDLLQQNCEKYIEKLHNDEKDIEILNFINDYITKYKEMI
jgi:hypothetical protein